MKTANRFKILALLIGLSVCAQPALAEESADSLPSSMYDVKSFNVLPFSDGIAWIQYGSQDDPVTSAVNTDGDILFTLDGTERICYLSPFSDGSAYYIAIDDSGTYEVIIDAEGNITWQPDRDDNEHVIAAGEGVFVVERHTTGFYEDQYEIGTVDAYGNTLQEYAHEIGGSICDRPYHLDRRCVPADTYTFAMASTPMRVSCYLGDGLFYLSCHEVRSKDAFYNPETGTFYQTDGLSGEVDHISNGRFRLKDTSYIVGEGKGGSIASLYDTSMNLLKEDYYYYYERTGQSMYGLEWPEYDYDASCTSYRDGWFYKAHTYWDDDNQMVLHMDGFSDRMMQGGPFYDDRAVMWIEGADKNKYVTVIDREGNFQFEPICIKDGFFTIWNGYFLAMDTDQKWNIYDVEGNKLRCITDDMMPYNPYGILEYTDIDEGFLTVTYDQKQYKMLYSIERALNGEVRIP